MNSKEWTTKIKEEKPEMIEFITKLESFISETGFDGVKFERAVNKGLSSIEIEVTNSFKKDNNAENKESSN